MGRLVAVNLDPFPTESLLMQTTGVDMYFSAHARLLMNTNSQRGRGTDSHTDAADANIK